MENSLYLDLIILGRLKIIMMLHLDVLRYTNPAEFIALYLGLYHQEYGNKKGVEIGFNVPKDMLVYADENMLKSTIRNLATNAVKFTPKGGKITLTAKPVYDNFVEISFKDTGIGMNKDILDKLFRLDAHTSRPGTEGEPSSGLGLILCKDFIDYF